MSKSCYFARLKAPHGSQRGFTLLETLLAAAIFGLSGFLIAQAFNNGQMALLNWELSTELQKEHGWAIEQIAVRKLDRDAMEEGGVLTSVDGHRVEWYCDVSPTEVLDLFVVDYFITVSGADGLYQEFRDQRLYHHQEWYEDGDRERLVEEKEKQFELMKRERERR